MTSPLLFRIARNEAQPSCPDQEVSGHDDDFFMNPSQCVCFSPGMAEISDMLRHVIFK